MERKDGFLIIDDYKRVEKTYYKGRHCVGWVTDGQNDFLFKKYDYNTILNCYRELVYAKLATKLGMKNVGYDLAIYRGVYGVITKNCTSYETISMEQIINNYLKKYSLFSTSADSLFNIQDMGKILKDLYGNEPNYNEEEMHRNLMLYFYFQILSANPDLCSVNIDMEKVIFRLFPLYDFGSCGLVDLKNTLAYDFSLVFSNKEFLNYPLAVLHDFLKHANFDDIQEFQRYLEEGMSLSFNNFLKELEEEKNTFVPTEVRKLIFTIPRHFQNIQESIQKIS